jgi:hypothetical protein
MNTPTGKAHRWRGKTGLFRYRHKIGIDVVLNLLPGQAPPQFFRQRFGE